ncbi:TetR/AcrR family transcriptional regulator [Demequina sp. NBRC 110053]|uniref:TetR/AcrR family transcriptional regulator n=1 Tax=Demequina sp. NBRC 110053 TaxID=1570342 RepID=UPI0009FFE7CF|nr:TetR/AcrR family transcriptional regulator [Demequina sp. NBRC 110053]
MTQVDGAGQRPPTKFQIKRERTRSDLLRLGIERFLIRGYAPTTIEDVVRDSGYTRGAFYFHFGSKEEFFLEVLRARRDLRGEWWAVVEAAEPADLATALTIAQTEFARTDPQGSRWTMVISEFADANRDDESLMAPLRELHAEWCAELGRLMTYAQERGWCRTDLTADELAQDVLAITAGYGFMFETYRANPSRLMDVYLRYLEAR